MSCHKVDVDRMIFLMITSSTSRQKRLLFIVRVEFGKIAGSCSKSSRMASSAKTIEKDSCQKESSSPFTKPKPPLFPPPRASFPALPTTRSQSSSCPRPTWRPLCPRPRALRPSRSARWTCSGSRSSPKAGPHHSPDS